MRLGREAGWQPSIHFHRPSALFLFPTGPSESSGAQEMRPQGVYILGDVSLHVMSQSELAASTIRATNKPYRGLRHCACFGYTEIQKINKTWSLPSRSVRKTQDSIDTPGRGTYNLRRLRKALWRR